MILEPIIISLKVSVVATIITAIIGIFFARIFVKYDFKCKEILEVFILIPMILPPSVTGYGLLILIGNRGIIGKIVNHLFGVSIVFSWYAACMAAVVVSLPLMYQSCKAAFLKVDASYEDVARDLGADDRYVFWKVIIPLSYRGIISGIVLSFCRAIGEFGATMMVAGNIFGKTQTIPIAIYFAVEDGDYKKVNILIGIVLIFSFINIYVLNRWVRRNE